MSFPKNMGKNIGKSFGQIKSTPENFLIMLITPLQMLTSSYFKKSDRQNSRGNWWFDCNKNVNVVAKSYDDNITSAASLSNQRLL